MSRKKHDWKKTITLVLVGAGVAVLVAGLLAFAFVMFLVGAVFYLMQPTKYRI